MPLPKKPRREDAEITSASSPARGIPRNLPKPESLRAKTASSESVKPRGIPTAPPPNMKRPVTPEGKPVERQSLDSDSQNHAKLPKTPVFIPAAEPKVINTPHPPVVPKREEVAEQSFSVQDSNNQTQYEETAPAVLSAEQTKPESLHQEVVKPRERSVYDELDAVPEEDEEALLDKLLGLDDDSEDAQENPDFEERPSDDSVTVDDDEDSDSNELDFAAIMRQLEDDTDDESVSESKDSDRVLESHDEPDEDNEEDQSESTYEDEDADSDEDLDDDQWNKILSVFSDETPDSSSDREVNSSTYDDDEEDDDEEDEEFAPPPEDDFVPPANPFAIPEEFATEDSDELPHLEDEEPDEEVEDDESIEEPAVEPKKAKKPSAFSAASLKEKVSDYLAGIKAELHGEDPPKKKSEAPKTEDEESISELEREYAKLLDSEKDSSDGEEESEDGSHEDKPEKSGKKGGGIFGFLSPVKSLYMGIVNLIFGVISGILGILAKLPLIGFIFSAALGATHVLKAIATYLPIVFIIGVMAAVSYFSIPREATIALPDSGGASLSKMTFDSESNTATGVITNTGEIIAPVEPEFTVYTIQPGINPLTWFMPEPTATCFSGEVSVDIDAMETVAIECSGEITGFIPRVGGELK